MTEAASGSPLKVYERSLSTLASNLEDKILCGTPAVRASSINNVLDDDRSPFEREIV